MPPKIKFELYLSMMGEAPLEKALGQLSSDKQKERIDGLTGL